jgi:hypothetical protein
VFSLKQHFKIIFSNVFSLGANKEDSLQITHHITSSFFLWLKFILLIKVISTFHVIDIWTWNVFSMFGHEHIFFLFHCDLHLLKMLNIKLCSPHYMCIMWKETIERINGPKKKIVLFFLCLPYVFKFLVTKLFWYVFW